MRQSIFSDKSWKRWVKTKDEIWGRATGILKQWSQEVEYKYDWDGKFYERIIRGTLQDFCAKVYINPTL